MEDRPLQSDVSSERIGFSLTLGLVVVGLAYVGFRLGALTAGKFALVLPLVILYWWASRPYPPFNTPMLLARWGVLIRFAFLLVILASLIWFGVGGPWAIGLVLALWLGPRIIAPLVALLSGFLIPLLLLGLIVGVVILVLRALRVY